MRLLSAILIASLFVGCAGDSRSGIGYNTGQSELVSFGLPFLAGVPGVFLTNTPSFSGRASLETSFGADSHHSQAVSGTLLSSDNHFLFVPVKSSSGKRGPNRSGSGFIWNAPASNGFVLNEPLQAYAPFAQTVLVTNITVKPEVGAAALEKLNGHSCRVISGRAFMSDGSNADFTVWKAEDMKGFPLRVKSVKGTTQTILNLSDIQFEQIDRELFLPPDGFAQYPTPQAMVDELLRRQNRSGTKGLGQGRQFDDSTSWTPHERGRGY